MSVILANTYSIYTGKNVFTQLKSFLKKSNYSQYFILCDENSLQHCLPILITNVNELTEAQIIEMESGESNKTLEIAASIWQTLLENKADKNCLLINLGGGVVSDLGGFCASVYKRGIPFIHVPTTLLSMVDASVGGKTGIDFMQIKNAIGTFSNPKAVFVSSVFLSSLPENHIRNGLAEVYKMALVADHKLWKMLNNSQQNIPFEIVIETNVDLKNKIVSKDPMDKGIRKSLNFGHTIGHALESAYLENSVMLLHGEAVVIGMIIETHIAFQKKLITKIILQEIVNSLTTYFKVVCPPLDYWQNVQEALHNDKKNKNGKKLFSLIQKIGKPALDIEVSNKQIERAILYFQSIVC